MEAILFVCQSCRLLDQDDGDKNPADGTVLLNQLLALHQNWSQQSELKIQPASCLLTCNQACAVALQCTDKATYLLTNVPPESAEALMQFSELYLNSEHGNVAWKKIPAVLKSDTIARIPTVDQALEAED